MSETEQLSDQQADVSESAPTGIARLAKVVRDLVERKPVKDHVMWFEEHQESLKMGAAAMDASEIERPEEE